MGRKSKTLLLLEQLAGDHAASKGWGINRAAADIFGVSRPTIINWLRRNEIPAHRLDALRFRRPDLFNRAA